MEAESEKITANLSPSARAYLASLGLPDPDADQATAELIWYHALAVGYSPAYLAENADGIRQDWPRIPLPQAKDALARLRGPWAAGGGPAGHGNAGSRRDRWEDSGRAQSASPSFSAWTGNRRTPKPAIWT